MVYPYRMDEHDYNHMINRLEGNFKVENPFMTDEEPEFSHLFKAQLCALCGESCFTPCDLLLEYEEVTERLECEYNATSRTIRRSLQARLNEIEEEVQED